MEIGDILRKFEKPKRAGKGWQVRCPAHDDRVASLSISNGSGKILLHCHAGCDVNAIVAALGLTMADLFVEPRPIDTKLYFKGAPVIAIYNYRDATGNLVYRVLRNAKKNFAQQRLTDTGEWEWKGPEKKLLYRLPELLASDPDKPVFIPEGEKDIETLRGWGLVATCNSGGGGKFTQDNEALRDRLIITLEDNDETGAKHVADVARKLKGIARQVINIKFDGLPLHGDVTYWKEQGHTKDELLAILEDLLRSKPANQVDTARFTPSETLIRPKELTLMGLAARFHERFYRDTRYVEVRSAFYNYAGGVWRPSRCATEVKTKEIINEVHNEVAIVEKRLKELQVKQQAGDQSVLQQIGETFQYLESLQKFSKDIKKPGTMESILLFSRSDLVIGPDDFDHQHSILNVANGTIDLDTGKFREHRACDLCSMQSAITYNPDAACERWLRFLLEIFLGEQDLIDFTQRAIGYSLSGFTSEQIFLILHGDGSNGKTVLLWVLEQLFGDYVRSANIDTFMDDKPHGGHNEDIARLRGSRLVITSETEKTRRLAEALVKRLTGDETITASFKHERSFEFTPRFKVWLAANHKPTINGTDYGIWRRILLVPFSAKFVKPGVELGDKQFRIDPKLRSDLAREMPGILNWAIQGYQQWRSEGLNPPKIVKAVTEDYRTESDKLGAFLSEEMIEDEYHPATLNSSYHAYKTWAENGGMRPSSIRGFASDLRSRGIEIRKSGTKNDMCVIGYALLAKE